jgi:MFS family permease
LREPIRGYSDPDAGPVRTGAKLWPAFRELAANRVARILVVVFIGANFVAMVFTVWMPTYLFTRFHMSLSLAGLYGSAYMQAASIVGVTFGGIVADSSVRRHSPAAARMRVQAVGLVAALPFLFFSGWATRAAFVLAAVAGFGLGKGIYESSLWASLYDVVPIERRGASVGLMNSLGWLGAGAAQLIVGIMSQRFNLATCLSATGIIYLAIAITLIYGASIAQRCGRSQISAT